MENELPGLLAITLKSGGDLEEETKDRFVSVSVFTQELETEDDWSRSGVHCFSLEKTNLAEFFVAAVRCHRRRQQKLPLSPSSGYRNQKEEGDLLEPSPSPVDITAVGARRRPLSSRAVPWPDPKEKAAGCCLRLWL
ncbi:hypothetical protein MRB53_004625 [Persea americana]|uniref:Uncharacterized protein n=1 Tax=Persea americana TaxID=3435 RepID=A0ACC2MB40_PERAE|nr:hypothetical protein MRB53_004625 [Persea americana]